MKSKFVKGMTLRSKVDGSGGLAKKGDLLIIVNVTDDSGILLVSTPNKDSNGWCYDYEVEAYGAELAF